MSPPPTLARLLAAEEKEEKDKGENVRFRDSKDCDVALLPLASLIVLLVLA